MGNNTSSIDDFHELRKRLDDDDQFVQGGHQIVRPRKRKRETPVWAANQKQVQQLLLRSFPTLKTNDTQRKRAARWARIIYLHFVMRLTLSEVAQEMKLSMNVVRGSINNIRRVASGRRANLTGVFRGKRGRPKKEYANPDHFGRA